MAEPVTILLTSTDPALVASLNKLRPDLAVVVAADASSASALPANGSTFAFIDWLLPDLSGLELCRMLRNNAATRAAHLTMVLESHDAEVRRRALTAGADDYIVGPLSAEVLIGRIDAAGHASALPDAPRGAGGSRLRHGELVIDLAAFQVRFQGRLIALRPSELRLLAHFVEFPDQVFTRENLIRRLSREGETIDERTVDVWIGRLRRALRAQGVPDPLRTVRSLGYVLDSPIA
ncbi:winged helix-turn-helix domain-containing protein [Novosphingobium flavum]|uniref:Winged helix-turn-helix domain-containing protein n=1 Tax=Novosphingobium flavum TaxID=1778672 RepID=A0A7X1FUJ8_9SPHN|nr:response regulator transcription factor [Novosphingobium flavum]MBC2666592.1 winged helix-turn-helix domain-containing protein [Novosphingobium flavum]